MLIRELEELRSSQQSLRSHFRFEPLGSSANELCSFESSKNFVLRSNPSGPTSDLNPWVHLRMSYAHSRARRTSFFAAIPPVPLQKVKLVCPCAAEIALLYSDLS